MDENSGKAAFFDSKVVFNRQKIFLYAALYPALKNK